MAVTQHYALLNYWYWVYPWLDNVMHFSGGVLITVLGAAFFGHRWWIVVVTMCVGLLWEVFEYSIGVSLFEPNFAGDTALDVAMDFVGALVAYGIMHVWQTFASRLTAAQDASLGPTSSLR
jgi:hypothetical protein